MTTASDGAEQGDRITEPGRTPRSLPPLVKDPPPPAPLARAVGLGFTMAIARARRRPVALSFGLGLALVVADGIIERGAEPSGAVDRALFTVFRWVLPFVVLGVVGELLDRRRLADAAWPAARYGLAKRDVALGLTAGGVLVSAIVGAVLAALTVAFAHSRTSLPLASDVATSAWVGALAGAAYAAWFTFGATLGGRGGGRFLVLLAVVFFGASTGALGAILPNAHAQNLLGFAPPLHLAEPASAACLALMTIVLSALAALRCRD